MAGALPQTETRRRDPLSPAARSERMSRVRAVDTGPEWTVRRLLHRLGFRYAIHVADLPGRPDIVFRSRRKAVFVHGCFWHRHAAKSCKLARLPKSRLDFWLPKLERNHERDREALAALRELGWSALVVWECELRDSGGRARDLTRVERRLCRFLENP